MGYEFRGKGVNGEAEYSSNRPFLKLAFTVALAPGMNSGRAPAGGRNFEYAGADPYLAGIVAKYSIIGIQSQGVIANAKHFILNDQVGHKRTYGWVKLTITTGARSWI